MRLAKAGGSRRMDASNGGSGLYMDKTDMSNLRLGIAPTQKIGMETRLSSSKLEMVHV